MDDNQTKMIIENILRARGLRVTQPRIQIFSLLSSSQKALSAKDIFAILEREKNNTIDLASIYRNLGLFEEISAVHKLQDGSYQACATHDHSHDHGHDHLHVIFHCKTCGLTEEPKHDHASLCESVQRLAKSALKADSVQQITMTGVCHNCKNSN